MQNNYKFFQYKSIKFCFFLTLTVFLLSVVFNSGFEDFSFTLFLPIIFLLAGIHFYKENKNSTENKFLTRLVVVTFIIKLISIFVFTEIMMYYNNIPFLSYKDDYNYYNSAVQISRIWDVKGISIVKDIQFSTGFYSGYPNINALVLYYFGESVYNLRILNSVVSSIIIVVIYKIMRLLFDEKSSKISIAIITFSTMLIYFSSFILKDIILLLFTVLVIYGFIKIILGKLSFMSIFLTIIGLVGMIFFRAATIIPLFIAFFICYTFSFFKLKKNFSYISIFIFLVIAATFFKVWDYISSYDIIQDSTAYYEPRIDFFSERDLSKTGSNIGKLGILSAIGIPLFVVSSIFLPSFLFINLGDAETINYQASAIIYHIAILPFIVIPFFYCLKNFKKITPGVLFIIITIIVFKIGLASSVNSLFSARQSLGATFAMYLILPAFFHYNLKPKLSNIYFAIAIMIVLVFNLLRLFIRL